MEEDRPRDLQLFGPFLFAAIQAAVTTGMATFIATLNLMGWATELLLQWPLAWVTAWLVVLPVVIALAPLIHRPVRRLTAPR